ESPPRRRLADRLQPPPAVRQPGGRQLATQVRDERRQQVGQRHVRRDGQLDAGRRPVDDEPAHLAGADGAGLGCGHAHTYGPEAAEGSLPPEGLPRVPCPCPFFPGGRRSAFPGLLGPRPSRSRPTHLAPRCGPPLPHGPPAGRVTCVPAIRWLFVSPGHGGGIGLLAIGLISLTALFRYSVARRSPLNSTRSA